MVERAVAQITPAEIVLRVKAQEDKTKDVRDRMDSDYDLATLEEFGDPPDGSLTGIPKYTTNAPRTFLNLMVGILSRSTMLFRVPPDDAKPEQRAFDSGKERVAIGMIDLADERNEAVDVKSTQSTMGWHACVRGVIATRAVLLRENGQTKVDVTVWDGRNTYWQMGKDGLDWVCYKIKKTNAEILAEYPGSEIGGPNPSDDDQHPVFVYDYYDRVMNTTFAEATNAGTSGLFGPSGQLLQTVDSGFTLLKEPTPYPRNRDPGVVPKVPVSIVSVGAAPKIQSENNEGSKTNHAESIFNAARETYSQKSWNMSALREFVRKSLHGPYKVSSPDADLQIDPPGPDEEINLRTDEEDFEYLQLPQIAPEVAAYFTSITGEMSDATVPETAFGSLRGPLSGFAITKLNENVESALGPPKEAVEIAMKQVVGLLIEQYLTLQFGTISFQGATQTGVRQFFSEEIAPEVVAQGGRIRTEMLVALPEDDAQKIQLATILRGDPANPFLPDSYLWENVMKIQDPDLLRNEIYLQQSQRGGPMPLAYTLMQASNVRGDTALAQIWQGQLMIEAIKQKMQMIQLQLMQMGFGVSPLGNVADGSGRENRGGDNNQQQQPGPQGIPANIAPAAALGFGPPTPNPQAGPLVAPGTPRPGAQGPRFGG